MIKQIGKQNILFSPFIAEKQWSLSYTNINDLILISSNLNNWENTDTIWEVDLDEWEIDSSTESEFSIALEYVDYTLDTPALNRECNIILEQQDNDIATFEEGIYGNGVFHPSIEAINIQTNTFKRSVYNQTKLSFYNDYKNPLQLFGMDNIDFPLSKTDLFLTNKFLLVTIPQKVFGDKMKANTIELFDHSIDDTVTIKDDNYGNLIASSNLFSKIQEVKPISNTFLDGEAETC